MRINRSLLTFLPEEGQGSGTVTSVALSATMPTGLEAVISGSPITTAGTLDISLSYALGYAIPTTIKQSNWDDAYTWVSNFPSQSGQSGKFLTTNGSVLSWGEPNSANIYNTSGTLTGNRLVSSGGYFLQFDVNIGIGKNPSYPLDVNGIGYFSSNILVQNIYIGPGTGSISTNIAIGFEALLVNTTGFRNVVIGYRSGLANTTGSANTFVGYIAATANTTGSSNTFVGDRSGIANTTGNSNTFIGTSAGIANTTASNNTFVGVQSGLGNTTGTSNVALGGQSLFANTTGIQNIAIGHIAGRYTSINTANATSNRSIYIGYNTRSSADGNTNEIVIGDTVTGNGSNTVTLGNTSILSTILRGKVLINSITTRTYDLDVIGSTFSTSTYTDRLYVNTTTNVTSALVNVESTNKGILIPRLTDAQRVALVSPAIGLLIYQTDVTEGLWQFTNGSGWQPVGGGYTGTVTSVGLTSSTVGVTITNTPITSSGNINIEIAYSGTASDGLLGQDDWNTFNDKMNNPFTALGQMLYSNAAGIPLVVAPNTSTTKKFLSMTGSGTSGAAPVWSDISGSIVSTAFQIDYDSSVTGLRNSVNKVFTVSSNFVSGSTRVFVNGLRYSNGASYDYTETASNQITFTNAPDSGDLIIIEYIIA